MGPFETTWSLLPNFLVTWLCAYYHSFTHVEFVAKPTDGAWLFRSGGPWLFPRGLLSTAPVMSTESIRKALRIASSKPALAGSPAVPLPEDVRLLDINLLQTDTDDQMYVNVESMFFAERQDEGDFILWPMNGVQSTDMTKGCHGAGLEDAACPVLTRQPGDVGNATIRSQIASSFPAWDPDNLDQRVEELHSLVHRLKNTAIFFHCSCGCDRTGQLFAAYAIAHMNWTMQDALKHNSAVAGRSMWYEHQVSVQWYCEWLRSTGDYLHDDCGCGGDLLCAAADYYLDPFARRLQQQFWLALLGAIALSIFIRMLRRRLKCCRRYRDYDDIEKVGLTSAFLTPEAMGPFGKPWLGTPSTRSPSLTSSPAFSTWNASLSASPGSSSTRSPPRLNGMVKAGSSPLLSSMYRWTETAQGEPWRPGSRITEADANAVLDSRCTIEEVL